MASCCKSPTTAFRHRLAILTLSQVSDGQGGFSETWPETGQLYASIEPTKGQERFQAQQVQTPVTHKITTRYRSDLTTKNRLKFGTRVFRIKELLNENEDRRILNIKAIEMA